MKSSCLAKFPAALALLLACPAHAADILDARYDPASDQISAEIAYRGTNPDHDFSVQWGQCSDASPPRVVGRLIDAQGDDIAREDYRVGARIGLEDIPCRPTIVTLRLGRVSHLDVFVPRQVELLDGTPQRPYEEIGRIEARALGADAVISIEEHKGSDPLPPTDASEAPLLSGVAVRY